MSAGPAWHAVTTVVPVPTPGGKVVAQLNPRSLMPVRAYLCSVCGYVELYAGAVAEPAIWGTYNG